MRRREYYNQKVFSSPSYKEGYFLSSDSKLYLPQEVNDTNRSNIIGYCLGNGKIMSVAYRYGRDLRYSTTSENTPNAPTISISEIANYTNGYSIFKSIIESPNFNMSEYPQHKWCYELGVFAGKQWYLPTTGELYPLLSSLKNQSWITLSASTNPQYMRVKSKFDTAGISTGYFNQTDGNVGFFTTEQASTSKMWIMVPNYGFRNDLPKTNNPYADRFATIALLDINS